MASLVAPRRPEAQDGFTGWRRVATIGLATVALAGAAAVVTTSGSSRGELLQGGSATGMVINDNGRQYAYKRISVRQAVLQDAISPSVLRPMGTQFLAEDGEKNSASDFHGDSARTGSGMTHVPYEPAVDTLDYGLIHNPSKHQWNEIQNYLIDNTEDGKITNHDGDGILTTIDPTLRKFEKAPSDPATDYDPSDIFYPKDDKYLEENYHA